jgi:hypothetical protein
MCESECVIYTQLPSSTPEQTLHFSDPRVQQRIEEILKLLQEIEDNPSRKAFTDGILPNELGC